MGITSRAVCTKLKSTILTGQIPCSWLKTITEHMQDREIEIKVDGMGALIKLDSD